MRPMRPSAPTPMVPMMTAMATPTAASGCIGFFTGARGGVMAGRFEGGGGGESLKRAPP
jgi:hypothetical protein